MNMYLEFKKQKEKDVNEFPFIFAFNNEQLIKGMKKLGLKETDTDKLLSIGNGGYIRKSDKQALSDMFEKHNENFKKAIKEDLTGEGFIYDMFNYELANHEYCITYEIDDTLDALGLTIEEIKNDSRLLHGLRKAIKNQENNSF